MAPPPSPLRTRILLYTLAILAAAAHADGLNLNIRFRGKHSRRAVKNLDEDSPESPAGCLYDGRWYRSGAPVVSREACLRCACVAGALSCARRSCAALPDPPPPRCHVLHRKQACCPELHCSGGVYPMEQIASTRVERDDFTHVRSGFSHGSSCVEGGTVYSAGSAMSSATACEQCFCLGGSRRCVRPTCLAPPPGCSAHPTPGACCPQRYYCHHTATTTPGHTQHDCVIGDTFVAEGERVVQAETGTNCTQCFCLRGAVRCQGLACAPPLLGCTPLLRAGQCCPHQYQCHHNNIRGHAVLNQDAMISNIMLDHNNINSYTPNEDRSFRSNPEMDGRRIMKYSSPKDLNEQGNNVNKVKRKTTETYRPSSSSRYRENIKSSQLREYSTGKYYPTTDAESTTEVYTDEERNTHTTEQPEEIVKIMINGTINCTSEISSSSHPVNISDEEAEKILAQSLPRNPSSSIDRMDVEDHTFDLDDLITDQKINGKFDDNDSFTINVTSSLRTNTSYPRPGQVSSVPKVKPGLVADFTSKKPKEEYDYDYMEPTLPPSLPNLKIIPFVAADAVLDEKKKAEQEHAVYPVLEREDKFPVYYSKPDNETPFASRREDNPAQNRGPVFISDKLESRYAAGPKEVVVSKVGVPGINDLTASLHEYAASASLAGLGEVVKKENSAEEEDYDERPAVNLFSPPVETEGGFIPKGPAIIDEYYAVYPSTPPGPHIPHLTTSMQLDPDNGDCIASDGRKVLEGESVSLACSVCACAWGELHCSPRPCLTPPGCTRRTASLSSTDRCCGELVCRQENKTSSTATPTTKTTTTKKQRPTTTTSTTTTTEEVIDEEEYEDEHPEDEDHLEEEVEEENASETTPTTLPTSTSTRIYVTPTVPVPEKLKTTPNVANLTTTVKPPSTTLKPPVLPPKNNTDSLITNIKLANSFATTRPPYTSTENPPPSSNEEPDHHNGTEDHRHEEHGTEEEHQEYEEEEEEDEGFSFGSVLKLLLSETYDTTTTPPPFKKMPSTPFATTESPITREPSVTYTLHTPSSTSKPTSSTPYSTNVAMTSKPVTSIRPSAFTNTTPDLQAISYTPTSPAPTKAASSYRPSTPSAFVPTKQTATSFLPTKTSLAYTQTTTKSPTTSRASSTTSYSTRKPPVKPTYQPFTPSRHSVPFLPPKPTMSSFVPPTMAPFIPLPQNQHQLYAPPKNYYQPTSVNRIDHLVLGEATAIRKPPARPVVKPAVFNKPVQTTKMPVAVTEAKDEGYTSVGYGGGLGPLGLGGGGLKLAGCNIYGKMYSVGRLIAELSSGCRECRCTELGVNCHDLRC